MKNKTIIFKLLILSLILSTISTSCQRKELYYPKMSRLKVAITWPSTVDETPLHNQIVLSTLEGETPYKLYMDGDVSEYSVEPNEYKSILYNWRTNASAQTVQFRDEENYEKMTAFTGQIVNKSSNFDDYSIYLSPDMLFVWSSEELGEKKIVVSGDEDIHILNTYPKPVVTDFSFHVEVVGLEYVTAVSAVAAGFSSELTLHSKKWNEKDAAHKLDIRVTESGFQCNFAAFNFKREANQRLHFVIKLPDGTFVNEYRDVDIEIDKYNTITKVEKIVIEFDGPAPPLPGGGGFEPPEIGDWEGVEEDIII